MNIGRAKIFLGTLIASVLFGAGSCNYSLYKQFENTPHPFRECLRWPFNEEYAQVETLLSEYKQIHSDMDVTEGIVTKIERHGAVFHEAWSRGRHFYTQVRPAITFITLDSMDKFVCADEVFANEGSVLSVNFLSINRINAFEHLCKNVDEYKRKNPLFASCFNDIYMVPQNYFLENDALSVLSIVPKTKLNHLDGIVTSYEILQDE